MNRQELLTFFMAARPGHDDTVYVERRGDTYGWRFVHAGEVLPSVAGDAPDVWIYFSGAWPVDDRDNLRAFCDDLLAEMESMAGGADRCRWPLDSPWPHMH
jgi:hypothetical protein